MRKFDYFQLGLALTGLFVFIILAIGILLRLPFINFIDELGYHLLYQHHNPEATWFFYNATRAGNPKWTALVMIVTTVISIIIKKYDVTAFIVINVGCFGLGAMALLKDFFARARPDVIQLVPVRGFSFPSGHSMNAILLYGSIIILLHYYMEKRPIRLMLMLFFATLIIIIPISRVYLGVHFLSDVIGGMGLSGFLLIMSKEFIFKYRTREVFEHA